MKPREPRRKIVVSARMRMGARWSDVRILDASSRGFMIHLTAAPPRGTYVELWRGRQRHVARVVWQAANRCGLQTQDKVSVDELVKPPEEQKAPDDAASAEANAQATERRSRERSLEQVAQSHVASKALSRTIEYGSMLALGALGAFLLFGMFQQAVNAPMARVSAALSAK